MKSKQTAKIERILGEIERRYDPEKDLIPGGPDVTWVDAKLVDVIKGLSTRIDELEYEIDQVHGKVVRATGG